MANNTINEDVQTRCIALLFHVGYGERYGNNNETED